LEGVVSIARAFLSVGAASVVASLWDVEDASADALLEEFHRHYVKGASPSEALRTAQLSLINGQNETLRDPKAWSAFVVVGTDSARYPVTLQRQESTSE
jgi:CHAT domain-containing protein